MIHRVAGATDAISDTGKILIVFRKQADGTWRRLADAWNSDLPAGLLRPAPG